MNPLKLGKDFALPAQIVTRTIAILGLRGAGKSNTATVLVEEMLDQNLPPVIIDPTDAWWGLRSEYPVFIFGGSHGDVPLQEQDGRTIAEFIVRERVPVVLSLRHLRKAAQRRFVADFCEEIYHLKGRDENRTSLTVVIDEAPLFVPQKVMGETARVVGAVEDLIARGRNAGFGVVLIGQRAATINKDVLTQSDVIMAHRMTSPQDKKALAEWFEDNATSDKQREILASLASLADGCAWVWAPTLKLMEQVQIRRRATFDSSATPELGRAIAAPKKLTEVNLDSLKAKMAATIERAKADDPKSLKQEVARLKSELAKQYAPIPADSGTTNELKTKLKATVGLLESAMKIITRIHAANFSGLSISPEEIQRALEGAVRQIGVQAEGKLQQTVKAVERIQSDVNTLRDQVEKLLAGEMEISVVVQRNEPFAVTTNRKPDKTVRSSGDFDLGKCPRTLLAVLMQFHPNPISRNRLALVSGYSLNSSGFVNAISELRVGGLAEGSSELRATEIGRKFIGDDFVQFPTGREAVKHWIGKLGQCPAKLLGILDEHGGPLARHDLANASGYSITSSGFSNALSELRVLGLIQTDRESAWVHPDFSGS